MIFKSYIIEKDQKLISKLNSILFYGVNIGLKRDFKNIIKDIYKKSLILNFVADEIAANPNILTEQINNFSLFNDKKLLFIENTSEKLFPIIKEVVEKINNDKIIIFSDILDKKSKLRNYFEKQENIGAVPCYMDDEMSLKRVIQNKLKNFEGLSSENINLIISSCNLDRAKLNNELSKIISFFNNKKLEKNNLEKLLDVQLNSDFSLLKDEAFNGNKITTNKLLSNTIIDGDKNILYLNIINQRLNKLAETFNLSKNTNLEKAIGMIRPPIFWKDKPKFIMQVKKWNLNKIKNILNKTYNLEIEIKTNPLINKNILIKKLLLDICALANA